jgi:putative redox protein
MVEIKIDYSGELQCKATHGPSGTILLTDAPVDNQGLGRSFSPTDLLATALGTCVFTVLGIVGRRDRIDLTGATMVVRKEMTSQPVRRVGRLLLEVRIPRVLSQDDCRRLEHAAQACPVKRSLHPDVDVQIHFRYGDQ